MPQQFHSADSAVPGDDYFGIREFTENLVDCFQISDNVAVRNVAQIICEFNFNMN
jgi:hypothetical protein